MLRVAAKQNRALLQPNDAANSSRVASLKSKAISTDFEIALMRSMSAAYPDAELQGCFFHLEKNLKKKIRDLHLMSRYKIEPGFALAARMIAALAFVPPANFDNFLAELSVYLPEGLMPVSTYFKNTYNGKLRRLRPDGGIVRKNPLVNLPPHSKQLRSY